MMTLLISVVTLFSLLVMSTAHHGNEEEHLSNTLQVQSRPKTSGIFDNYIDRTLGKVFDKVKRIIGAKEPYPVPSLPPQKIFVDENTELLISLSNVRERKASQVYVNRINTNIYFLTEQFYVTFPEVELEGIYHAQGKISGKSVNGNGNFKAWITDIHSWGTAYGYYSQGSILLKDMTFDYTFDKIRAEADGLEIEGLSQEEVVEALNNGLTTYFRDREDVLSKEIARNLQIQANEFLNGKSVSQLIAWLTRFIAG